MEAKVFCADIADHARVHTVFLATKKSLATTKTGKPYLMITLADRTGDLEGRMWDEAERWDPEFAQGDFVLAEGRAETYLGKLQLKLDAVRRIDPATVDVADFLPSSRYDVNEMYAEVLRIVDSVRDAHVRKLLAAFLDDPTIGPLFKQAPAAKNIHHSYLGGLLEHTLSVLQLGLRVCDHYPRVDRDLVIAGALLHDIGKVRELKWGRAFDYTDEGRLVGHLVMTTQWIHEKARAIPGFPEELRWHLVHLVAAHHGELEHGSPKVPHTVEAMIVHAIDELDSRVNSWLSIIDKTKGERWTEFQRIYDRYLFKGPGWRPGDPPLASSEPFVGPSIYATTVRSTAQSIVARLREMEKRIEESETQQPALAAVRR